MIVPVSFEAHHTAHLEPILANLPHASARRRATDISLVASYGALCRARRAGFTRHILTQHGAGQSYGGDRKSERQRSYPGGSGQYDVGLFLVPNEHAADRWRRAYPRASVAVVGCPKLDVLPARVPGPEPVVAVSFHWNSNVVPEMRSGEGHYIKAVAALARRYKVIGHGHPKRRDLARLYRATRIEYVPLFEDICRRADVYVCDNSSTIFEFAATGRPVVVLNRPDYRRHVNHGLRFWDAADVGINVDHPADLRDAITEALRDDSARRASREAALDIVYAYRTGAAKRAAEAIMEWAGTRESAAA
jgi:glycosyltransferase involved in cell wall biosynthesis